MFHSYIFLLTNIFKIILKSIMNNFIRYFSILKQLKQYLNQLLQTNFIKMKCDIFNWKK